MMKSKNLILNCLKRTIIGLDSRNVSSVMRCGNFMRENRKYFSNKNTNSNSESNNININNSSNSTTSNPDSAILFQLSTLSPLDGRYSSQTEQLRSYFSESALIKYRTIVEIEWLKFLLSKFNSDSILKQKYKLSSTLEETNHKLDSIISDLDLLSAHKIKSIEKQTNHDV